MKSTLYIFRGQEKEYQKGLELHNSIKKFYAINGENYTWMWVGDKKGGGDYSNLGYMIRYLYFTSSAQYQKYLEAVFGKYGGPIFSGDLLIKGNK